MEWHSYLGPVFYKDKNRYRQIEQWYENAKIVRALEWFERRGNRA